MAAASLIPMSEEKHGKPDDRKKPAAMLHEQSFPLPFKKAKPEILLLTILCKLEY